MKKKNQKSWKDRLYYLLHGKEVTKDTRKLSEVTPEDEEFNDAYLFDFLNYASGYRNSFNRPIRQMDAPINGMSTSEDGEEDGDISENASDISNPAILKKSKQKIKIKPIDVVEELERIPTPFELTLIDEKISILEDKSSLLTQRYAKRSVEALKERMFNRKRYIEFKSYFETFTNTNDEKIGILLEKYDLVMKTSELFIPSFPDDCIKIMKSYEENMLKLCNKKPIFYVIAEPKDFKSLNDRLDPILLVQSPFGFYWQILGAWDQEMLILSEL